MFPGYFPGDFRVTTAQNRRLQEEISRTLKKVTEGIELFEQIWDKVYSAPTPTQKEKFESELKKEIKKLQRLRDSIKTWLSNSDIKDKTPLQEARKSIEVKMELFKEFEKETKTKAYSKAGLAQPTKQDPESMAKYQTQVWLNKTIEQLQLQMDTFEADIEQAATSKKAKGKRGDNPLEHWLIRHKYHVKQLERILRLLDNDKLSVSQVFRPPRNLSVRHIVQC